MKTKLDFYHMTPFYELNYFIAFIVKFTNAFNNVENRENIESKMNWSDSFLHRK